MSSMPTSPRMGWIGLGSMGLAMAINIQRYLSEHDLPALKFWNRTISRGESLETIGGVPCQTIADLTQTSDVVFISVSNDAILQGVVEDMISSGHLKNKILVDTTTIHPDTSASTHSLVHAAGGLYVAAPVFGAKPVAEAGRLLIALAGPEAAIQYVGPFLKGVIARDVILVGSEPQKALLLKTTSNFVTAGMMYLVSEAHVLAEKSGLPAAVLESLMEENFGAYMGGVSKRMTQGVYLPSKAEGPFSALELGIKDVGHGLGVAERAGMRLKVGEMSMEAMKKAKEYGDAQDRKLDSSSVYGAVRVNAGLDFENEAVKRRDGAPGEDGK